jgi:hypothetical protein
VNLPNLIIFLIYIIPKLSYLNPSDAHGNRVKGKHANLVFHLDTIVMKNANDMNQLNKDSF